MVYQGEADTEIEDESLVRLRLITHNARLVDTRKELGMTQADMAQAISSKKSISYQLHRLSMIENLKVVPTLDEMAEIARILVKPIDYLFPEELLSAIKAGVFSRRKVELAVPEVISLTEAQRLRLAYDGETTMIEEISRGTLAERIDEVLDTISPREKHILELRFGLKNGQSRTLAKVGEEFGLTGARIHSIEQKALRKLRHPSRSRRLKDYLE